MFDYSDLHHNVSQLQIYAKHIWLSVKKRFAQRDAFRLLDLIEEFYFLKQGSMGVSQYFTNLKVIWDEMSILRSISNCSCEPACYQDCHAFNAVKDHMAADYVIKFLKG